MKVVEAAHADHCFRFGGPVLSLPPNIEIERPLAREVPVPGHVGKEHPRKTTFEKVEIERCRPRFVLGHIKG